MIDSSLIRDPFAEGLALLKMRDHLPEAEAAFRAGLVVDPDHVGCLLYLGVTLRNLGRLKEASAMLLRARELSPDDPVVHMQIGTLLRAQKKMDAALDAYDAALAIDPGHVNTRVARTITLQGMNRWDEALSGYDSLIADLPDDLIAANVLPRRRAEVIAHLARISECGVVSSLPPQKLAVALYRRANQLVLDGAIDEAVRFYEDSALLAPDYSDPEFPIGETVAVQMARRPSGEYLSCRWIEECLHFHHDRLALCCTTHTSGKDWPIVGTFHGGPVPIDFVLARRDQLTLENQTGVDNACRGCRELERRPWPIQPWVFSILIINNHTVCNQKCDFCFLAIADFDMPAYYYMAEPAIEGLIANGWLAPNAYVLWGGGEPTLSREFPRIASKLYTTGCRFNIYSNATRVMPILVDALKQGRCDFVTSVDSGTPETFYRIKYRSDCPVMIKGRPAFDTVWANIEEYTEASSETVIVKYIFTLQNIADADIYGFIEQCIAHGVTRVMLLTEVCDALSGAVPAEIWDAMNKTVALAHAKGLSVYFNPLHLRAGNIPASLMDSLMAPVEKHAYRRESTRSSGLDEYMGLLRISVSPPP
jgi:tetratricopeptide (TPR) repeat protein